MYFLIIKLQSSLVYQFSSKPWEREREREYKQIVPSCQQKLKNLVVLDLYRPLETQTYIVLTWLAKTILSTLKPNVP